MNENWSRWLFASLSVHFNGAKGDLDYLHIQGTVRKDNPVERGEFRWTGADFEEQTAAQYKVDFTVGILLTVSLGEGQDHRVRMLLGRFSKAAEGPIYIYKYGKEPGDDASKIGCLLLKGKVRTHEWGQLAPDVKVTQASVECDYTVDFKET